MRAGCRDHQGGLDEAVCHSALDVHSAIHARRDGDVSTVDADADGTATPRDALIDREGSLAEKRRDVERAPGDERDGHREAGEQGAPPSRGERKRWGHHGPLDIEIAEHREHAPVVAVRWSEVELAEDAADVLL